MIRGMKGLCPYRGPRRAALHGRLSWGPAWGGGGQVTGRSRV